MKIGIDFGTTTTSVVVFVGGLMRDIISGTLGDPTIFMHRNDNGKTYFGYECDGQYAHIHPNELVRNIKTLVRMNPQDLNNPNAIILGNVPYSYREIVKQCIISIINKTVSSVKAFSGDETVEEVCITAPATSAPSMLPVSEYRKMLMEIVKEVTGLPSFRIHVLAEPTAAAIHYFKDVTDNYKTTLDPRNIMVLDIGGGTLDINIVSFEYKNEAPSAEIKLTDGDPDLGGNLWDKALAKYVLDKAGIDSNAPGFSEEEEYEFLEKIVRLKIDLTGSKLAAISFLYRDEPQSVSVTRDEFKLLSKDLLERVKSLVKKTVDAFDGGIDAIDNIILVGGSCNMQMIHESILEIFPTFDKEAILLHDPSKAIAKGAAIFSNFESNNSIINDGMITECTYGVDSCNSSKTPIRSMIYNVIFKETKFNNRSAITESSGVFTPLNDSQQTVRWVVYESNVRACECEDDHWIDFGEGQRDVGIEIIVEVPDEYLGKARSFKMYPKMSLDTNGVLTLEIYDSKNNLVGSNQARVA